MSFGWVVIPRKATYLYRRAGQDAVAGVDDSDMSPLAGPASAAAVILKPGTRITGINDPKKLDANSREALAKEIKEKSASLSVAFVEVEEIDTIPQHLLIDAKRLKEIEIPQQAIIQGDAKSANIAAASILAKVSRDALMRTLDTRHIEARSPKVIFGSAAPQQGCPVYLQEET
jgi:ribonuclease HII